MGGCRCTFRGCMNTTSKTPSYHFFHFPVKAKERCELWIKMSKNEQFSTYPEAKLKNQNVCEDHFKLAMFMNIKRERLTRFAYPSLLKVASGETIDLEHNNLYELDWNVKTQLTDEDLSSIKGAIYVEDRRIVYNPVVRNFIHQMPSESGCEDADILIEKAEDQCYELHHHEDSGVSLKPELTMNLVQTATLVQSPSGVVISKAIKRKLSQPIQITQTKPSAPKVDIQVLTPVKFKKIKPMPPQIKVVNVEEVSTQPPPPSLLPQPPINFGPSEEETTKAVEKRFEAQMKQKIAEFQAQLLKQRVEIEQQKKQIAHLKTIKPTSSVAVQAEIVVPESPPSRKSIDQKPAALSKAQLFSAIKRYLSSAMATMVKMEMFGSSERDWKADEKKLSSELLNLGDDVYQHFVDEWRLRLPPKADIMKWMNECLDEEEDL